MFKDNALYYYQGFFFCQLDIVPFISITLWFVSRIYLYIEFANPCVKKKMVAQMVALNQILLAIHIFSRSLDVAQVNQVNFFFN